MAQVGQGYIPLVRTFGSSKTEWSTLQDATPLAGFHFKSPTAASGGEEQAKVVRAMFEAIGVGFPGYDPKRETEAGHQRVMYPCYCPECKVRCSVKID